MQKKVVKRLLEKSCCFLRSTALKILFREVALRVLFKDNFLRKIRICNGYIGSFESDVFEFFQNKISAVVIFISKLILTILPFF